jgi:hypothetical protein
MFWLTLFSSDNIRTYLDPDDEIKIPYLISSVPEARARFERRLPELRNVFKNIDSYVPKWLKWLDGIDKNFIKALLIFYSPEPQLIPKRY